MITLAGAMSTAEVKGVTFGGREYSSRYLPLEDPNLLRENQETMFRLIDSMPNEWQQVSGGFIANCGPGIILDFLIDFNHQQGPRGTAFEEIIAYINERYDDDELVEWTVALMSPTQGASRSSLDFQSRIDFRGFDADGINMTRRGMNPNNSFEEIMDKLHLAIDLDGYPDRYRDVGGVRLAARTARPPRNGLLILYILDPDYAPPSPNSKGLVSMFGEDQEREETVAFGLALPDSINAIEAMGDAVEGYWGPRGIPGEMRLEEE